MGHRSWKRIPVDDGIDGGGSPSRGGVFPQLLFPEKWLFEISAGLRLRHCPLDVPCGVGSSRVREQSSYLLVG